MNVWLKGIKPDEEELRKICRIADSSGKVKIKVIGPDNQIDPQSNSGLQLMLLFRSQRLILRNILEILRFSNNWTKIKMVMCL